jgi:hypothetical protein
MAIVRVYDFLGGTLEQYDRVMDGFEDQFGYRLAPGNLLHAAGAVDGGFRALDVFESRDVADHVAQQVGQLAGPIGLAAPVVSEFETHNLLSA